MQPAIERETAPTSARLAPSRIIILNSDLLLLVRALTWQEAFDVRFIVRLLFRHQGVPIRVMPGPRVHHLRVTLAFKGGRRGAHRVPARAIWIRSTIQTRDGVAVSFEGKDTDLGRYRDVSDGATRVTTC